MTRRQLAQYLGAKYGVPWTRIEPMLDDVRDHILDALKTKHFFTWRGLGTLRATPTQQQRYRNPRSGGTVPKAGTRRSSFRLTAGARAFLETPTETLQHAPDATDSADRE